MRHPASRLLARSAGSTVPALMVDLDPQRALMWALRDNQWADLDQPVLAETRGRARSGGPRPRTYGLRGRHQLGRRRISAQRTGRGAAAADGEADPAGRDLRARSAPAALRRRDRPEAVGGADWPGRRRRCVDRPALRRRLRRQDRAGAEDQQRHGARAARALLAPAFAAADRVLAPSARVLCRRAGRAAGHGLPRRVSPRRLAAPPDAGLGEEQLVLGHSDYHYATRGHPLRLEAGPGRPGRGRHAGSAGTAATTPTTRLLRRPAGAQRRSIRR